MWGDRQETWWWEYSSLGLWTPAQNWLKFILQRDATRSGFQSFWRNINSAAGSWAQTHHFYKTWVHTIQQVAPRVCACCVQGTNTFTVFLFTHDSPTRDKWDMQTWRRSYRCQCAPDPLHPWLLDTNTHICSAGDVSQKKKKKKENSNLNADWEDILTRKIFRCMEVWLNPPLRR